MRGAIGGFLHKLAVSLRHYLRPELTALRIGRELHFGETDLPERLPCRVLGNLNGISCVFELRLDETAGLRRFYELLQHGS